MVYYGLLFFFVLEYVRPASYVPALGVLHLNSVVAIAILVGSIFTAKVGMAEVLGSHNARWIIFLLALLIISGLTCEVKHSALDVFTKVIQYCFIFVVLKKELHDFRRIKGVLSVLVCSHVIIVALNPQLIFGDGQRHYVQSGFFLGDGNDFALSVNIVLPFALFLLLESQTVKMKLVYAGSLVLLLLSLVSTQSRGGVLALAAVGFYYWIKSDRKILGVICAVIVLLFIQAVAPTGFADRMETITKTGEERDGSAQGRILAWTAAIKMAVDHPVLGVGAGHFPVQYGTNYRPDEYGLNEIPWHTAHSSYFLILGELGIPGITFLLGIIICNLVMGERILRGKTFQVAGSGTAGRDLMIALNASLIAFAVGGAFLSAAYYPHLYVLAGLLECGREVCGNPFVTDTANRLESGHPIAGWGARA